MLLGSDIGGTKTLLALARVDAAGKLQIVLERSFASREHASFSDVLRQFLEESRAAGIDTDIEAGCIGVAGPIRDGRAKVTYLPWHLDATEIGHQLAGAPISLVNDFAAAAAGVLDPAALPLVNLQDAARHPAGARVVLGAGTGLGVAALTKIGDRWKIVAGEGGHVGFAPIDEQQARLRAWLAARDRRVTVERILSGAGLADIYRFVCSEGAPVAQNDPLGAPDPAAAIAAEGLVEPDSACGRALALFCSVYGAFAGDLALLFDARGGVFLAGGIAAKVLPALRRGGFVAAFDDKGVHSPLAANYAVEVVMEPRLGLLGALQLAAKRGFAEA